MHHRSMTARYFFILFISLGVFTTDLQATEKPESANLMVCLAIDDDAALESLNHHLTRKLSMTAREPLPTQSVDQFLFLMQDTHLHIPNLLQNLQVQKESIHASFSDFIAAFNTISPRCYTGPSRTRQEIAELIHAKHLFPSVSSQIYADETLTVLSLDNQASVSISHIDTDHAAFGLRQLDMDKLSDRIWLGTSHSMASLIQLSGSGMDDYLNQMKEYASDDNFYFQGKTEVFRRFSETQKTTQSHPFRKASHEDTSTAVVWAIFAVAIVFAAVLPFGFFMAFI